LYNNRSNMFNIRALGSPAALSRTVRRLLVATSITGSAAGIAVQDVARRLDARDLGNGAGLVLLLVGVAATLIVWRWSRNRARWEDEGLDERDRRERDRSWAMSYRILALAVILVPGTLAALSLAGADVAAEVVRQVLVAMIGLVLILPTLVLAWVEPDMPAEDT
jgi:cytochrome bd-type quinol oxidase subunit 2